MTDYTHVQVTPTFKLVTCPIRITIIEGRTYEEFVTVYDGPRFGPNKTRTLTFEEFSDEGWQIIPVISWDNNEHWQDKQAWGMAQRWTTKGDDDGRNETSTT